MMCQKKSHGVTVCPSIQSATASASWVADSKPHVDW
jgi:hypothetical protein